jgi:hypothetical protein
MLLYFYSATEEMKLNPDFNKIYSKLVNVTEQIFEIEFEKGKTMELINGDTLEMPLKLLRNHHNKFIGK